MPHRQQISSKRNINTIIHIAMTQKKGIEDFLKKEYKTSDVELTLEKKDSLIGGFIIKVGNKEYDWSLAGRCKRLTQRLVTR